MTTYTCKWCGGTCEIPLGEEAAQQWRLNRLETLDRKHDHAGIREERAQLMAACTEYENRYC